MTAPATDDARRRALASSAAATAAVGAAFCAVVAAMMVTASARINRADPLDSPELRSMKSALRAEPDNEQLKRRIRRLDLGLRRRYFRARRRIETGVWLLAGGGAVIVAGAAAAGWLRRPPLQPGPGPSQRRYARQLRLGRWSVAGLGLLAAAGAAGLAVSVPGPGPLVPSAPPPAVAGRWCGFRGPGGLGVSGYTNLPVRIVPAPGGNVRWTASVPLPGKSSPIVWDGRIFLTGATERTREVYCYDAATGRLIWRRPVGVGGGDEPPEVMEDTGYAAPTPATDGRRVCAIFANGELASFDLDGQQLWSRSLGVPVNAYGHASSLVMHDGLLLVLYDQGSSADEGLSALIAFDAATGEERWSVPRPVPNSWATPIVIRTPTGTQLVTSANPWVTAYDPADGSEIWRARCLAGDVAPTPTYADGVVYAVNTGAVLAAIRTDGTGDVTDTHVVWTARDGLPDIVSPLAGGRCVYLMLTDGLLTCYEAATGKTAYEEDFLTTFIASPTLVGRRVYLLSKKGELIVFEAGATYRQIARSELGAACEATPAFVDGAIVIRARGRLYCVGADAP